MSDEVGARVHCKAESVLSAMKYVLGSGVSKVDAGVADQTHTPPNVKNHSIWMTEETFRSRSCVFIGSLGRGQGKTKNCRSYSRQACLDRCRMI